MKTDFKNKKSELYIDAIGLNTIIILSKDLFPTNYDVKQYTDRNIKMELKDYLFDSRTLLIARTNRYIYNLEMDELRTFYKNINNYITNEDVKRDFDDSHDKKGRKDKVTYKKNKSKDNLKTWLDKI